MHSTNNKSVKVAAIQQQCSPDRLENRTRAMEKIRQAASNGAEIVCLQELFSSRYFCQSECHDHFAHAEPIPGPISDELGALASQLGIVIVASIFERRAAGIYHNSAIVLDTDGSIAGIYRKMHIPDDPCYYEKFYFTPGDLGFQAFDTAKARIGVCICWDQWFPEAARLTALSGAEIIVYPTAIGWLINEKSEFGVSQQRSWQTVMQSHCITNGVFVVAPNRVGLEDQIEFWGHSFIADPYGNILAVAASDTESTLICECDLSRIETARTHWPFLRDRRIDAYGDLTKRFIDAR